MKIITEKCCDSLLTFSSNSELKAAYNNNYFDEKFLEYLKNDFPVSIPSSLFLDPDASMDLDNSIKIFELLKDLDPVMANDRRLWVTLTHTVLFHYSKSRWLDDENSDNKILRRFHFEGSSLEARMRNSVSRLWWAAKITYDGSRQDPYELTKLLWSKQDIYQNLVERSYGTYGSVVKGFLEFYSENQFLRENQLRKLFTALNSIGGVKILSIHTKDEIKAILSEVVQFYNYKNIA